MAANKNFCFTHPGGKDIYLYSLINEQETEVLLTNYGAILLAYKIKMPDKSTNDIVLGFDNVHDYLRADYLQNYPYFGAAIGRYANRIKNALFEIDSKKYQLSKNAGHNQLHGGFDGFDKQVWETETFDEENNFLELSYFSKDGEEGFPGNLTVRLSFELTDDSDIIYSYTATTDAATAINLTHHSYFNLNNGQGTIDEHELKIYADKILEQDEFLCATGNYIAVDNTAYDFREFKKIEAFANNGYDQSFVIANEKKAMTLAAELKSANHIKLQVITTEPVIQFYTAQGLKKMQGKKGNIYEPYSGLCLETQVHPNAINIPQFPNTVLRPGEVYHQKTIYKICFEK